MRLPKPKRFPKNNVFGRMPQVPRKAFADPDRDLVPNLLDCNDRNPRKQGPRWEKFKGRVGGAVTKVKEYAAKRRETRPARLAARHETRMTRLQRRTEATTERQKEFKMTTTMRSEKTKLGMERVKLLSARQKAMPSIGGLDIGRTGPRLEKGPSVITQAPTGLTGLPTAPKVSKRKKAKRKKAKKYKYVRVEG